MQRDLERAYAACERLARAHDENFPAASPRPPAAMRPHVAAGMPSRGRPTTLLTRATVPSLAAAPARRLGRASPRGRRVAGRGRGAAADEALVFAAVGHSIRTLRLPVPLFEDLVSAFRQDVTTRRYADWAAVLDYCRRSANPVG